MAYLKCWRKRNDTAWLADKGLAAGQVANENGIGSDGLDECLPVAVQDSKPSEVPHLWRAIEYVHWDATPFGAQIPHTAIVLLSEIDDCNERPHHPPTNIRTDFAAALSHITVCRYTVTSAQRISAWRCTMERASKKQCASVLRQRDVDNTATAFAGSYSKAGIKAELAFVDVHRTQGLPVSMVLQSLLTGAAPMSGTPGFSGTCPLTGCFYDLQLVKGFPRALSSLHSSLELRQEYSIKPRLRHKDHILDDMCNRPYVTPL
ncbi:hypothetical protein BU17DRAFT_65252 [Hysterangium stoloniferum]|nr:hypothetical protein BU17DRAFT_65252 [Hysterangium stoloniferum]